MRELTFEVCQTGGTIACDFDALERLLEEKLREYDGALFTVASKATARGEVANLRKLKKQIDDRRKEVKTEWLKPYQEFEERVKRLLVLVDKPITLIDGQIKEMEEQRVRKRREDIRAYYKRLAGDCKDVLPLEKFYQSKWDNASVTLKAAEKELEESLSRVRAAEEIIQSMDSEAVPKALELYRSNLDLGEALAYINRYEAQRRETLKKEQERKHLEEEQKVERERERIRREERERVEAEARIREEVRRETVSQIKEVDEAQAEPLKAPGSLRVVYTVVATVAELEEIEMALTSLGVYFERKDI